MTTAAGTVTPTPFPPDLGVAIDPSTREVAPGTLLGGAPRRVLRLSRLGRMAWSELRSGATGSTAAGVLARRLTDAGLAHPRPSAPDSSSDLTIVVPAYGRPDLLAGCLGRLGDRYPIVVVDDGSRDAATIAAVASEHGAVLVRRDRNGGPAAARNTGLATITTEHVAFIDSDCEPPAGWIEALSGHFSDPLVAAVAPRIVPASTGQYRESVGLLDLGPQPGRVRPGARIGHVPTAAILVRQAALQSVGGGFDERLRYGEDVDLVWRLDAAGWRVRYDPSVTVAHREPRRWSERAARRFHYGSAAAPLSLRHPGSVPPLVVAPLPLAAVGGVLARRPVLVAAALLASIVSTGRALRRAGLPPVAAPAIALEATGSSWVAAGRAMAQFGLPTAVVAMRRRRRESPRAAWSRRLAVAALLTAGPIANHRRQLAVPGASMPRFVSGQLLDDLAYGAGVVAGCIRHRTTAPLRPVRSIQNEGD